MSSAERISAVSSRGRRQATGGLLARDLLRHALGGLLVPRGGDPPAAAASWADAPLVIVSSDGTAASECLAEVLRHSSGGRFDGIVVRDGAVLGGEIAAALESGLLPRLQARLAAARLLVVDHVDRLGGGDAQRGFASLVDALSAAGTAVCVSLSSHPAEARDLAPAVSSRLCGGLVVHRQSREPAARPSDRTEPGIGRILRIAARHHDLDVADLTGPSRRRAVVEARGLAIYLARTLTTKSLAAIGTACGNRDHTTVLHATRSVAARIACDPALATDVSRLMAALTGGGAAGRRRTRRLGVGDATRSVPPPSRRR